MDDEVKKPSTSAVVRSITLSILVLTIAFALAFLIFDFVNDAISVTVEIQYRGILCFGAVCVLAGALIAKLMRIEKDRDE